MKTKILIPVVLLLLTAAVLFFLHTARDPIGKLVEDGQKAGGLGGGVSALVELPETATPEEIIAAFFEKTDLPAGHVNSYQIKEIRKIQLSGSKDFTAALVASDRGTVVVLLRYIGKGRGWSTSVYEAK